MRSFCLFPLLVAFATAQPAFASWELARDKQCLQCHSIDRDTIGPSFLTIQAIYKPMDKRQARLVAVIQDGSGAHLGPLWGRARMPDSNERPLVTEEEARRLSLWILSLQPRQ